MKVSYILTAGFVLFHFNTSLGQDSETGRVLFERNCAKCHGRSGKKGLLGARNLVKTRIEIEQAKRIVRNGRGLMPAWKEELTAVQVDSVIAYILTLRE